MAMILLADSPGYISTAERNNVVSRRADEERRISPGGWRTSYLAARTKNVEIGCSSTSRCRHTTLSRSGVDIIFRFIKLLWKCPKTILKLFQNHSKVNQNHLLRILYKIMNIILNYIIKEPENQTISENRKSGSSLESCVK